MATPTTPWSTLDLSDRETLTSGFLAWLLNPNGDHGLGNQVLLEFAEASGLSIEDPADVDVTREAAAGGGRKFDVLLESSDGPLAAIEVKCKTSGRGKQLMVYDEQVPCVVRVGFGEWNFPDLTDQQRDRFPLVTLREIGDVVLACVEGGGTRYDDMLRSFSRHLIDEAARYDALKAYYITEEAGDPPEARGNLRLGNRFTCSLFWRWFMERVDRERPDFVGDWKSRSEPSGVWCIGARIQLDEAQEHEILELGITLVGPLFAWVSFEISNGRSLFGDAEDVIGTAKLAVRGEATREQRWDMHRSFEAAAEQVSEEGFRPAGQRPSADSDAWSALRKPLTRAEMRYSNLVRLADLFQ